MTVVAALVTPEGVWMGGDSLASTSSTRIDSSTPKVLRSRNLLVGITGDYGTIQIVSEILRKERDHTVQSFLAEYEPPGKSWEMLLADGDGIYEYSCDSAIVKVRSRAGCSYDAIGTGDSVALGSLYAWHDGRDALRCALKAAEVHSNRVRGPFKIVTL